MKKLTFILLSFFLLLLSSCNDDHSITEHSEKNNEFDTEVELRDGGKCCNGYTYSVTSLDQTEAGCCFYQISFLNTGFCTYELVDHWGNQIFTSSPPTFGDFSNGGTYSYGFIEVCEDDQVNSNGCRKHYIRVLGTENICEDFMLCADCDKSCCDEFQFLVVETGFCSQQMCPFSTNPTTTCCTYNLAYSNVGSYCPMFMFDGNGNVIEEFPAGAEGVVGFERCRTEGVEDVVFFGPSLDPSEACGSASLDPCAD